MNVSLVGITKIDWSALDRLNAGAAHCLVGSCYTTESSLSPSYLGLPLSHITINFAVIFDEPHSVTLFAQYNILPSFVRGGFWILTGSFTEWEHALVSILKYNDLIDAQEAQEVASKMFLLLEAAGFRDILIKYNKELISPKIFYVD